MVRLAYLRFDLFSVFVIVKILCKAGHSSYYNINLEIINYLENKYFKNIKIISK
jgi:hypothetical protein